MSEHGAQPLPETSVWLSASLAADACAGAELAPSVIYELARVAGTGCAFGPAVVVQAEHEQHIRPLLEHERLAGAVLVVGGLHGSVGAILGGAMAEQLAERGLRGIVTDGRVRDSAEIAALGLGVWCAGTVPRPAAQPVAGASVCATVAGVRVAEGDVVVADDDGIVVWPAAQADELLRRAFDRHVLDHERRALRLGAIKERAGTEAAR